MLIYGKNTAIEAIKTKKPISKIYLSSDLADGQLVQMAKNTKAEVIFMPRAKMNAKFSGNHQGIMNIKV